MSLNVPTGHESCLLRLHVRPLTNYLGTSTICSVVATVLLTDHILYDTIISNTCLHFQYNAFSPIREQASLITCILVAWLVSDAQLIEMLLEAKLRK